MILFYNQINADEIVSWIYNCAYINEKQWSYKYTLGAH